MAIKGGWLVTILPAAQACVLASTRGSALWNIGIGFQDVASALPPFSLLVVFSGLGGYKCLNK